MRNSPHFPQPAARRQPHTATKSSETTRSSTVTRPKGLWFPCSGEAWDKGPGGWKHCGKIHPPDQDVLISRDRLPFPPDQEKSRCLAYRGRRSSMPHHAAAVVRKIGSAKTLLGHCEPSRPMLRQKLSSTLSQTGRCIPPRLHRGGNVRIHLHCPAVEVCHAVSFESNTAHCAGLHPPECMKSLGSSPGGRDDERPRPCHRART